MRVSFLAAVVTVCLCTIGWAGIAAGTCPAIMLNGQPYEADADSVHVDSQFGSGEAGYDLRIGRLFCWSNGFSVTPTIEGSDVYQVVGVPADDTLSIRVELRAFMSNDSDRPNNPDCTACSMHEAYGTISLSDDIASDGQSVCLCGHATLSAVRDLRVAPGQDFTLSFYIHMYELPAGGLYFTNANILFTGVPASAQLVSCHGVNDAVPTVPSTWGRLKAAYR